MLVYLFVIICFCTCLWLHNIFSSSASRQYFIFIRCLTVLRTADLQLNGQLLLSRLTCRLVAHFSGVVPVQGGKTQNFSSLLSRQSWRWSHTNVYGRGSPLSQHTNFSGNAAMELQHDDSREADCQSVFPSLMTSSCVQQEELTSRARKQYVT